MVASALNIAQLIGGRIHGDAEVIVDGPCKIDDSSEGKITFLSNPKYVNHLYDTKASIVLVNQDFVPHQPVNCTLIFVDDVYTALSVLMQQFQTSLTFPKENFSEQSIDPSAKIGEGSQIDHQVIVRPGVRIGRNCKIYGHVFIGDNVIIGDHVTLFPGVKIYHQCKIGNHVTIHANTVIGSDGFGFAPDADGNFQKIAQIGNVVVGSHVEIGANTVIDRATMGSTIISDGVKLDNLIQIAHNVSIGANTVIAAQTGIAGSTKIGSNCMIGGQVGIVGHIVIADNTMIQAQSGVASSIKQPGTKIYGTPAIEYGNYLKSYAHFRRFQDLVNQLNLLKKEVEELKSTQNH